MYDLLMCILLVLSMTDVFKVLIQPSSFLLYNVICETYLSFEHCKILETLGKRGRFATTPSASLHTIKYDILLFISNPLKF